MNIGLVNVDGKDFPNFALMKISAFHKQNGDHVEWADQMFGEYDIVYKSKLFTFSPDDLNLYNAKRIIKGGTGYDIESRLPEEIENSLQLDYSIYPNCDFCINFFSRGCIRNCQFCLVRKKEGFIKSVKPHTLNENGKWVEILDNNFFANPEWEKAIETIKNWNKPIKFHGIDVRILDEKQIAALNSIKLYGNIHIAWDNPKDDLTKKLSLLCNGINSHKIVCYVLIGFNSSKFDDLKRVRILKEMGIAPFVMIYRDYNKKNEPTQYQKDFRRWCNSRQLFKTIDFLEFRPRKNFICKKYFEL